MIVAIILSLLSAIAFVGVTYGVLSLDNEVKRLQKRIEALEAKCP